MPVRRIEVEPESAYEAIDVTASATLKQVHKRYGEYGKRIAALLKDNFDIPKGHWQAYWTIATRVFGLVYGGHSEDVVVALGRSLGEELGLGANVGERIARVIYRNADYILGGKSARPEQATRTARRRR